MKDLGVDPARFETAFERKLYPSLGLSRGVFFPREAFGRDALVTGDPQAIMADDLGPGLLNARGIRPFVADFPVSAESKAQLVALYEETRDPLPDKSARGKDGVAREDELQRLPDQGLRLYRRSRQMFLRPHARFHRLVRRAGAGVVRARNGLSRLRGARFADARQSRTHRALHLSFPGRQCVDRAAAGARAHSRHRQGQDDGRHRAGALQIRPARSSGSARSHPSRFDRDQCPQHARRRRYRLYAAAARSRACRRGIACSPVSTRSFPI